MIIFIERQIVQRLDRPGLLHYEQGDETMRPLLAGEMRSVPLKVMFYEDKVDLGGTRFTAGMGLKF
jgi:hypothetical protein